MKRPEDVIKLFGMTNQLIVNDLDNIENEYDLQLGHALSEKSEKDEKYYPQFQQSIRSEANMMAQHYETFYCLEKSIRSLISETLDLEHESGWWDENVVPPNILSEVKNRIKKEIDSGVTKRSDEPIDYATFGELSEIIKKNWDTFGSIFNSAKAVTNVMGRLNTLRGPIAHCSPLAEDEILRLKLSVRDWFRLME